MKRKIDGKAKKERSPEALRGTGARASAYTYQPIDASRRQVRLLTVKHGSGNKKIQCSIKHASLVSYPKPEFEAVSYCWGDPSERACIEIDGTIVDVPSSSEKVLRRLRLPKTDRTLWIDAVCINQNDNEEKAGQVGIMGDVYSTATGTVIWLGEADDSTQDALHAMQCIREQQQEEARGFASLKEVLHDKQGDISRSKTGLPSSCDTDALQTFFARPWFQRLWVVQEAVLNPKAICYCGKYEMYWTDISRTAA